VNFDPSGIPATTLLVVRDGRVAVRRVGTSNLEQLRLWSLSRHCGISIIFTAALGMHWDKFAPVLFEGSKLFDKSLMRRLFRYTK
jgi:hypothetical protein